MKNNVVVFDLDGTLLNSQNDIIGGSETLNSLTVLQQMGCTLAICTGRLDHDIIKISQRYHLNMTHRISQNGAVIYKDEKCEALLLDKKEALDIYEYIQNKDVRIELNTLSHRYWKTERDPLFPKELYDSHIIKDDFYEVILCQPAVLFLVIGEFQELNEIAKYVQNHYQNTKAIMTSDSSLEIMHCDASKGNAIQKLYPGAHVYSIGDSPNDFDMFPFSQVGYLVSQSICPLDCIKKENILEALKDIMKRIEE